MKHRIFNSALLAGLGAGLLLCTGCDSREAKALNQPGSNAAPPAARPAWSWEKYPLMQRMRLGTLPCQLHPKSTMVVHSPYLGTLRVHVDEPQNDLPEGFLWAEFEPDIFAFEEKILAESRKRLDERERVQWEIELPRKKLQVERALQEADRRAQYARLIATNKEFADAIFTLPNAAGPLRPDDLEKTELEHHLLEQQWTFIQETNLTAIGLDLGVQRFDWERRNIEFQRRKEQSQFRMPFAGKLTVSLPVTKGVTEYSVEGGQELGVVRDFSSIRVRVPIGNPSWSSLPGEKLSATIRMPSGESIQAEFAYQKIERTQNREESVYYFLVPPERSKAASRLVGSHLSCELWVKLDQPAHIVPKLSLVLHDPEVFTSRSWPIAVSALFPGARVVAEGQTDVGIVLPKTLKVSQLTR